MSRYYTKKIYMSQHVKFFENKFPYPTMLSHNDQPSQPDQVDASWDVTMYVPQIRRASTVDSSQGTNSQLTFPSTSYSAQSDSNNLEQLNPHTKYPNQILFTPNLDLTYLTPSTYP